MMTQSRLIPFLLAGTLGAGALALIPARDVQNVAAVDLPAPVVSAIIGPPDPLLMRTLDDAVRSAPTDPARPESTPDAEPAAAAAPSETAPTETGPIRVALADPQPSAEPQALATPQPTARIGGSAVNYRAGPSSAAGRLGVLQAGEPVAILETTRGWVHIMTPDGRDGWIYGRFLSGSDASVATSTVAGPRKAAETSRATVSSHDPGSPTRRMARVSGTLPARAHPSATATTTFTLHAGQRVRIVNTRGAWMQVETSDGEVGWVRRAN